MVHTVHGVLKARILKWFVISFSSYSLLLGRKVMTNLDSILKSRDITLSIKVCLVKAMVFPVVMYKCESWTVKKAEYRRIDAFEPTRLFRPWDLPGKSAGVGSIAFSDHIVGSS